jgi:hypothetical protein
MRSKLLLCGFLVLAMLVAGCAPITARVSAKDTYSPNKISAELIGQVLNASPEVSAQYGYISYLSGFDTAALTGSGDTLNEQSALLTFYNDTTVESVINNGLTVVARPHFISIRRQPATLPIRRPFVGALL